MKILKVLLLSLSVSITLLLTFIISYLEPYELLFKEYVYFIVVINALVLVTICLITLLVINSIKYYNSKKLPISDNLFPCNNNYKKNINLPTIDNDEDILISKISQNKIINTKIDTKIIVEATNFPNRISLLNTEYLFIPGYTITLNKQQYKVIHKFRTDLSDKDIYGLKWDYVYLEGVDNDIDKNNTVIKITNKESLLKYEDTLSIGDIVELNRSLYKTELFSHETQYSKADILGSKYVFIWQSNK